MLKDNREKKQEGAKKNGQACDLKENSEKEQAGDRRKTYKNKQTRFRKKEKIETKQEKTSVSKIQSQKIQTN